MHFHLVVIRPFANHQRGDVIDSRAMIETILAGEHAACVVRVTGSDRARS